MICDAAVQMVTFFDSKAAPQRVGPTQRARVRVRTLVFTRWLAVFGQISALLVVSEGMDAEVPMAPAMSGVPASKRSGGAAKVGFSNVTLSIMPPPPW